MNLLLVGRIELHPLDVGEWQFVEGLPRLPVVAGEPQAGAGRAFGERHVDPPAALIETKEDKIMLTRNNELLQLGGKFPRLMKKQPKARLNEIKKLLLAL